jgi:hypothetical protein
MSNYPELGSRVTLANFLSAQTAEARVLAAPESRQGVANGIIVELTAPNETFWGVDLQVNKTILELKSLETALKTEDIDVHLMREYRGAVENIRTITETLQHLRKCQSEGSDSGELLSILASDRIQRIKNLCLEAVADADASQVEHDPQDVIDLIQAMQLLQQNLKQSRKPERIVGLKLSSHAE